MPLVPIASENDPRIAAYRNLRDVDLREREDLFVAEGRLSVERLIEDSHFAIQSVFVTGGALRSLDAVLRKLAPEVPVYLSEHRVMRQVVGYEIHRGCVAVGERGEVLASDSVIAAAGTGPALLVVLEEISNPENVGSVFRNAHAFGAAGVLLTPGCADPLYRKAIRVSMASSLQLPYARVPAPTPPNRWLPELRSAGFALAALTTDASARDLRAFAANARGRHRIALLVGSEGEGLSRAAIAAADIAVRIPMRSEVDSLNVATAVAIALHHFAVLPGADSDGEPE